ncbi:fibronectin type III domain-containing protein, partial [Sanguibacter suaedae]
GLAALVLGAGPALSPADVTSSLLGAASTGVSDAGPGSPDRLLGVVRTVSVPDAPDTEPAPEPQPEPEPELPGAPVGLAASKITTKGLSVSWTAPAGTTTTTFEVERSADGVVWSPVVSIDGTSARVNRLVPATRYVVRVRAVSMAGAGEWATVEATTASRPSAPRSPRASSRTPSTVTLTWAAPTTSGALVTDYRVEVSRDGRRWTTVRDGVSARTSARVSGLAPSVGYQFRVTPVADTDTVGAPATVRVSTLAAPSAPRNLKVTGRSTSTVSVRWTAPARSGAHVTDYRVQVSRDGRRWTTVPDAVSSAPSVRVTGLQRRTSYQVRVIAVAGTAPGTAYGRTTATTLR